MTVPLMSLGAAYELVANSDPSAPAVNCKGVTISRLDLERRSNQLARAYKRLGVRNDSIVTIALPNGIEFIEAMLATWKAGATPQPLSSRLPASERDAILELARPCLVVGSEGIRRWVSISQGFDASEESDLPLEPQIAKSWKAPTSGGSTGRPKLILSTAPAAAESVEHVRSVFQISSTDRVLVTGPLYHNAVFIVAAAAMLAGAPITLMPRFEAHAALELVETEQISWMYAVPTMMQRIWRLPEEVRLGANVSSLRTVFHTGAPCPMWLKHAWINWVGPETLRELYGGTEAMAATVISGTEWLEHPGSVGRPVFGEIVICDGEGAELGANASGEVWMRGSAGRPKTYRYVGASAKERDGWESLGDIGYLDKDGYLYLVDRDTDMILVGGANVYPAEVEAALDEHPLVLSSCVVGLPDDDMGNLIHAVVQCQGEVSDDELRHFVADRVAPYKVPRTFERSETPLRDDAGKVRRPAVRSRAIQRSLQLR